MNTQVLDSKCDSLFEALSAWIDGEATPEEARDVQAHLQACPVCQGVEAALRGLASAAPTVPIPEVPAGFAARTRKLVEERTERAWDVRARRLAGRLTGWLDRLLPAPDSLARALRRDPVLALQGAAVGALGAVSAAADALPSSSDGASALAALLQTRSERAGLRPPSFWLLLSLALYGLPAAFLTVIGNREFAASYLLWVGMGLLVALPWYHFRMDLAVLVSLRRGRCLEEILGAGLEPARMADSLASFSLRSLFRVSLPVALVLLVGAPLAGWLPTFYRAPLGQTGYAALAAVVWLLLTGILFSVGSYASQALVLFARGGERLGPACAVVGLVLFGPAVGLVALAAGFGTGLTSLGLCGALLWVGLAGRALAAWGFEHPARLERWNRLSAPRRNRWIRAWSGNPIVVREAARLSAAIPAGVLGLFLARLFPAAVQAQAAWALTVTPGESMSLAFWVGVAVVGWLVWLRASARTSAALAQEREGGTLEPLIQSGLTRQEFVAGWLQVACAPLYLELAVTAALVLMIAGVVPEIVSGEAQGVLGTLDFGAAALVLVALAAMPVGGAWAGLAVSAASPTRREAGGRAVATVFRSLGIWIATWGVAVAALTSGVLLFGLEFKPEVWNTLAGSVLPTAALGLTVLGLTWTSRRQVERHLESLWTGVAADAGLAPAVSGSRRRALVLGPALLAGLLLFAQVAVMLALEVVGLAPSSLSGGIWIISCLVAAVSVAALVWLLLRPLLMAMADHANRSPWSSALVAGSFGALAGFLAGSTPLAVRLFDLMGLLSGRDPLALPAWAMAWGSLLGCLACALVAFVGARFLPPGAEAREASLTERIRVAGGSPVLSAALVLVLVLGLAAHLLQQRWTSPEEQPELARQVYSQAEQREEALVAVPAGQNGFTLLEPVFMSRKYDLAQVRLSRRHQAVLEGFKALSWADQGDLESSRQALRAEPERVRQSAASLDAALPLLRQALDRPHFVVPPRWSEGPGGMVPNYILMRQLSQGLRLRAMVYEAEGNLAGALDTHLLNLLWSDRAAGQGPLIGGMICVALDSIAQEGLLDFMRRHRLSEPDLQRILRAQEQARLSPETFLQNVDNEFAFGLLAMERSRAGRLEDLNLEWKVLLVMPATYWERERRVYSNFFLRQREALRAERPQDADWSDLSRMSLAQVLLPNMSRAGAQVAVSMARQNAIRAVCLLRLHQLRTGRFPATLDEVWTTPAGRLKVQDPLARGQFAYQRTPDGFTLRSDLRQHPSPVLDEGPDGFYEWYARSGD